MAALGKIFGAIGRLFGRAGTSAKELIERERARVGAAVKRQVGRLPIKPLPPGARTSRAFGSSVPTAQHQFEPKVETRTVDEIFRGEPVIPPGWEFGGGQQSWATTEEEFLSGQPMNVSSTHVTWIKYVPEKEQLFICYHGGQELSAVYEYGLIDRDYALKVFNSGDHVGTQVWTYLRERGTVFGYQKPYSFVSGSGDVPYSPLYASDPTAKFEHQMIPESGAIPQSWLEGDGPYNPAWLRSGAPTKSGSAGPRDAKNLGERMAENEFPAKPDDDIIMGIPLAGKRQRSQRGKGSNPSWYGG